MSPEGKSCIRLDWPLQTTQQTPPTRRAEPLCPPAPLPLARLCIRATRAVRVAPRGRGGGGRLQSAIVHAQDPAQFVVQHLLESRGQGQHLQRVHVVGQELAQAEAAQVLQGRAAGAGPDHLHAALGCCRAHHGVKLLVLQLCGCHPCQGTAPERAC